MRALIIDDDPTIRLLLKEYCKIEGKIDIVAEFENGIDGIQFLKSNTVDVLFLDIHMPMINGVEVAKSLAKPPMIVMVTSDTDFALEAFEYSYIVDYLHKPLSYSRFLLTVEKLTIYLKKNENPSTITTDFLFVNSSGRMIKILYNDIEYVEANSDYVNIHVSPVSPKKQVVHSTLKKIKEKLPESMFIQVHRSYIINYKKIVEIEDNTAVIGKKIIPISKTYKDALLNKLNLL